MNEYKVSDYGIFTNAINTTNTLKTKLEEGQGKVNEVQNVIGSDSIFMGPAAEEAKNGLTQSTAKITNLTTTFTTIAGYLSDTSATYQAGDQAAEATVTDVGANQTGSNTISAESAAYLSSGTMKSYNHNGRDFNMVNTKIDVPTYQEYVKKNGLNQNAGLLGGDCMLLSQYYATDLERGTYTRKSTMANRQGGPATRINDRKSSTNPDEVLEYTYQQLSKGHPVVLQVSQVRSDEGLRHLVTAVGYASSVKSSKDLTPDNILVLDCVDGNLQTLGQARAEGGHERRLFAQGGKYQALGPTATFLAKEVTGTNA